MHLAQFGILSLSGTVSRPSVAIDIRSYELILVKYSQTLELVRTSKEH